MLLLLLLAQVASLPRPAMPIHNRDLRSLFNGSDYPPEAARNHWQGEVRAELTVDTAGRVSACKIIQSSGYQVLDDATCKILSERARFEPARDSLGNAVVDEMTTPGITWSMFP